MTRAEVKARVRSNLDDAGITFYTATDIEDSLQDAYYWTSIFANTVEKTVDISFENSAAYYNLLSIIPDLFAVTGVYDIARKKFLSYCPRLELISITDKYEVWPGIPQFFFIHSQTFMYIGPQPANVVSLVQTTNKDLKIFYRGFDLNVIDDLHTYRIPVQGEDCLEYYATADLLEQAQEWSKAQEYWDKFYGQLITQKIAIRDRPMPALINALAGVKL